MEPQLQAPSVLEPEKVKPSPQPLPASFSSPSPEKRTPTSASKRAAEPPAMSASRPVPAPLALLRSKAQELDLDLRFPYVRRIRNSKQPRFDAATSSSSTAAQAPAEPVGRFFAPEEDALHELENSAPADIIEPTIESAAEEFAFDPATHLTFGDCFF
jgi:hypothetical protein